MARVCISLHAKYELRRCQERRVMINLDNIIIKYLKRQSVNISVNTSVNTPVNTSVNTAVNAPVNAPATTSGNTSVNTSSEYISEYISKKGNSPNSSHRKIGAAASGSRAHKGAAR